MPDEVISVGIEGDASGLKATLQDAIAVNKTALATLEADYQVATRAVSASSAALADAQRQLAPLITSTSESIKTQAQVLLSEYAASEQAAVQQANDLAASIKLVSTEIAQAQVQILGLSAATTESSVIAQQAAIADAEEAAALTAVTASAATATAGVSAFGASSQVATNSARIFASSAGLGGVGYAMSRLAGSSTMLAPLMEAALPIALAVGFTEIVEMMVEKIIDLVHAWSGAYQAQKRYFEEGKKLNADFHKETQVAQKDIYAEADRTRGKTSGLQTRIDDKQADIVSNDKRALEYNDKEIERYKKQQFAGSHVESTVLGEKGYEKKQVQVSPNDSARDATYNLKRLLDERANLEQKQRSDQNELKTLTAELDRSKITDLKRNIEEEIALQRLGGEENLASERAKWQKVAAEAKKGGEATRDEYIQAITRVGNISKQMSHHPKDQTESKLAEKDSEKLADIKYEGEEKGTPKGTILRDERAFLEQRLEAEAQYAKRVRAIKSEIATLDAEIENLYRTDITRTAAELEKQAHKAETWARKLESLVRESDSMYRSIDSSMKREDREQDAGTQAQGSAERVGALETKKLNVQGAYGDSGNDSLNTKIALLRQVQAIDKQIFDEEIRNAKAIADIKFVDDSGKHAEAMAKVEQLRQKSNQKILAEDNKIHQLQEQRYKQFFNTIERGFSGAVDSWIRTGRGFTAGMQNLFASLVSSFADSLIHMGINFLRHEALKLAAHVAGNASQVTSDTATAAVSAGASSAVAVKNITARAASAAAGAFDATVDIPIVGPALAPAAGATAFAQVMGYAGLAAFESGGILPDTGLIFAHRGEGMMPRPLTQMLTNVANNGGSNSNSGDVTVHQTNNFHGMDDKKILAVIKNNPQAIKGALSKHVRSMNTV